MITKLKLLLGLLIYKIAPIKSNRYVFTSFNGHYSDNTKPISVKLHEVDKNAEIVWLVNDKYRDSVPAYAKTVDINSLKSFWYRGTAAAQIDNVYGFRAIFKTSNSKIEKLKMSVFSFFTKKRNQPIFATFHGTPLKKFGRDQIGNTVLDMTCPNSYLLLGDQFSADIFQRVTFGKMSIEVLGSPRNDILFQSIPDAKNKVGLPEDKKILLYAPTFRNDGKDVEGKNVYRSGINQLNEMDFDLLFQSLSQKFGGDWIMVCRFHYHVENMVDWNTLEAKYPGKFINGNRHDDMADYLACTDVLLTDASSSMFDFCKTKKPCFLYFPDIDNYRNKERGFYTEVEKLPYPLAADFSTLLKNINEFDQSNYNTGVEQLIQNFGSRDDGNSALRIANRILEIVNK